ncbi:hypothetical protein GGR50DRAFT_700009 [Xylaria sp. CBS 124048]|nr:hypothetical protein GGR50DRAFT_700009 [Xylaria sp. CBS 124048]
MRNESALWPSAAGMMQPVVAPDVVSSRVKHGNTAKIDLAVWIVAGLATSLVALRVCYHIFRGRRRLWSDDYFLLAALVCLIVNGVSVHEWIPYKYEPNVTTPAAPNLVLAGSLMGLFNSLALAFSKTSLAITFMRLTNGWWKSSLGLSVFLIDLLYFVQGWSFWVQDCNAPIEPYRIQSDEEGCLTFESISAFRLTVQVLSCMLDAYFTVLPWKIVRSLELKRFEKIGLGIAMSFGCASLASGLVRLSVLIRLVNQPYDHQPFYAVGGYLFNYFEPGYSIVAACMPVLRKVIMDHIKRKEPPVLPVAEEGPTTANDNLNEKNMVTTTETTTLAPPSTPISNRSFIAGEKDEIKESECKTV